MGTIFKPDDRWIIQSLLDVDFYKFTMGNFIWKFYRDVNVTFGLKNRTSRIRLAEIVDHDELVAQLDHVRQLRFNQSEISWLRGIDVYGRNMFSEEYLAFLKDFSTTNYRLDVEDGQFVLTFTGPWATVSLWETLALSIINELYYRTTLAPLSRFQRQAIYADGIGRLHHKIEVLKTRPSIGFIEFGTRRRFGRIWQSDVTQAMAEELPGQFRGTSNTKLAFDYGLMPMGTSAHELPMVAAALNSHQVLTLRATHSQVLNQWWEMYGPGLSIALTDTFGSDYFFREFGGLRAIKWKGLRQDSGDPFAYGERAITFYQNLGVDPTQKLIIFSDGLDLDTILRLDDTFRGRIKYSFGWGTTLTNDLGLPTLSLVAKAIEANGHPTVKLSDNLAKAMGPADEIEWYKRAFGYDSTFQAECVV